MEKCPGKMFTDTTTDVWRCVASCGERFVDDSDGPKCVNRCEDAMLKEKTIYDT